MTGQAAELVVGVQLLEHLVAVHLRHHDRRAGRGRNPGCAACSAALRPLSATCTVWPSRSSRRASMLRFDSLSSTTRIRPVSVLRGMLVLRAGAGAMVAWLGSGAGAAPVQDLVDRAAADDLVEALHRVESPRAPATRSATSSAIEAQPPAPFGSSATVRSLAPAGIATPCHACRASSGSPITAARTRTDFRNRASIPIVCLRPGSSVPDVGRQRQLRPALDHHRVLEAARRGSGRRCPSGQVTTVTV